MQSTSTSDILQGAGHLPPPKHGCGACRSQNVAHVGDLPVYIKGGRVPDSIWRCADCGTYTRAADYDEITRRGHFEVASYTNPDSEERLYHRRKDFFRYIIRLCEQTLGPPIRDSLVLDVGCAYGHLLDLLRDQGASTAGVEIVDRLRQQVARHGHAVYRTIAETHPHGPYDVVFLLDTLYYMENTRDALRQIGTLLTPTGRLILRVANRAPLLDLLQRLQRRLSDRVFGDPKYCFTYSGLAGLLRDMGFMIERVVLWERGKHHSSLVTRLYYLLSFILSLIVRHPLTPGLIVIVRPDPVLK